MMSKISMDMITMLWIPYSLMSSTEISLFVLPAGGVFQTEPPRFGFGEVSSTIKPGE